MENQTDYVRLTDFLNVFSAHLLNEDEDQTSAGFESLLAKLKSLSKSSNNLESSSQLNKKRKASEDMDSDYEDQNENIKLGLMRYLWDDHRNDKLLSLYVLVQFLLKNSLKLPGNQMAISGDVPLLNIHESLLRKNSIFNRTADEIFLSIGRLGTIQDLGDGKHDTDLKGLAIGFNLSGGFNSSAKYQVDYAISVLISALNSHKNAYQDDQMGLVTDLDYFNAISPDLNRIICLKVMNQKLNVESSNDKGKNSRYINFKEKDSGMLCLGKTGWFEVWLSVRWKQEDEQAYSMDIDDDQESKIENPQTCYSPENFEWIVLRVTLLKGDKSKLLKPWLERQLADLLQGHLSSGSESDKFNDIFVFLESLYARLTLDWIYTRLLQFSNTKEHAIGPMKFVNPPIHNDLLKENNIQTRNFEDISHGEYIDCAYWDGLGDKMFDLKLLQNNSAQASRSPNIKQNGTESIQGYRNWFRLQLVREKSTSIPYSLKLESNHSLIDRHTSRNFTPKKYFHLSEIDDNSVSKMINDLQANHIYTVLWWFKQFIEDSSNGVFFAKCSQIKTVASQQMGKAFLLGFQVQFFSFKKISWWITSSIEGELRISPVTSGLESGLDVEDLILSRDVFLDCSDLQQMMSLKSSWADLKVRILSPNFINEDLLEVSAAENSTCAYDEVITASNIKWRVGCIRLAICMSRIGMFISKVFSHADQNFQSDQLGLEEEEKYLNFFDMKPLDRKLLLIHRAMRRFRVLSYVEPEKEKYSVSHLQCLLYEYSSKSSSFPLLVWVGCDLYSGKIFLKNVFRFQSGSYFSTEDLWRGEIDSMNWVLATDLNNQPLNIFNQKTENLLEDLSFSVNRNTKIALNQFLSKELPFFYSLDQTDEFDISGYNVYSETDSYSHNGGKLFSKLNGEKGISFMFTINRILKLQSSTKQKNEISIRNICIMLIEKRAPNCVTKFDFMQTVNAVIDGEKIKLVASKGEFDLSLLLEPYRIIIGRLSLWDFLYSSQTPIVQSSNIVNALDEFDDWSFSGLESLGETKIKLDHDKLAIEGTCYEKLSFVIRLSNFKADKVSNLKNTLTNLGLVFENIYYKKNDFDIPFFRYRNAFQAILDKFKSMEIILLTLNHLISLDQTVKSLSESFKFRGSQNEILLQSISAMRYRIICIVPKNQENSIYFALDIGVIINENCMEQNCSPVILTLRVDDKPSKRDTEILRYINFKPQWVKIDHFLNLIAAQAKKSISQGYKPWTKTHETSLESNILTHFPLDQVNKKSWSLESILISLINHMKKSA